METAAQLADLSDEDHAKKLEGYLLIFRENGEIKNQEVYDAAKAQYEALLAAEDWESLAALINDTDVSSGGDVEAGGTTTLNENLEHTGVALQGQRTSSGNAIIGSRFVDPLERAIDQLDSNTRDEIAPFLGGSRLEDPILVGEEYRRSDYFDWLQNISEGDKERLAQALYVQGYYKPFNITDIEQILDPTYFANAIQGALRDAETSAATFGEDIGLSAVPTLEEGGRFGDSTEEEFREAERIFLRDSGPEYLPLSYLKESGRQISKQILGRHFNSSEERQYIAMANALLDDKTNPARLRNEAVDLQTAGAEFARELAPEEAEARNVGNLMSVVDKVLGL